MGLLLAFLTGLGGLYYLQYLFSNKQKELVESRKEVLSLRQTLEDVRIEKRVLEYQLQEEKTLRNTAQELIEKTQRALSEKFETLSHEAFFRSQKMLFDTAQQYFDQFRNMADASMERRFQDVSSVIQPLKTSLEEMKGKVQELEVARQGAYEGLTQQIASLSATQMVLHKEANNLAKALREPSARGRWGEIQLRRVVEMAGMTALCDFEEQVCVQDGALRPDMVIKMPHNRHVVVDAKVPLVAYLEAASCEEGAKKEKLVQHARQVRQHVAKLSQKKYWEQFPQTPDFVVLFLQGDCFLAAALEHDTELLEYASAHKVLLATPTSLIAMLKVIAYSWRQSRIEEHAQQIVDEARAWLERCQTFSDHFQELGKQIDKLDKSYDKAFASFESRLLVSARRLATIGLEAPQKNLDSYACVSGEEHVASS
jgi:DNA recombination protein RmuC